MVCCTLGQFWLMLQTHVLERIALVKNAMAKAATPPATGAGDDVTSVGAQRGAERRLLYPAHGV